MSKDRMIEVLGERRLLLPGLLSGALAANDRAKYLLTLLQTARTAADGAGAATSLREERIASGVQDAELDRVVASAGRDADGRYRIPGAEELARRAIADVREMLAPLDAAGSPAASSLSERTRAIADALAADGDSIGGEDLTLLCSGRAHGADSLHVIVMDAHRELNALQASIATESIDGARVYDLGPGDRRLVRAFVGGVRSTERLRLDHPGLGTIATRTERALLIQNDLGSTDAHVLVVRVSGDVVTLTYTDVHLERLLFFQRLLAPWPVAWEDTRSRSDAAIEGGLYHLASGRLQTAGDDELARFLERLGSRLVFIIDWNKARKRLRRLVGRRAAIELLEWSAAQGHGHVAFLRAGGDGLVYDALEFAGGPVARAGESLQDVLGPEAAAAYLRRVLQVCSEGLLAGRPVTLVQDEVRAELTGYLRSAREQVHMLALRHAELSVDIAETAGECLEHAIAGDGERCRAAARGAQQAERDADALVTEARAAVTRAPDLEPFLALVQAADDIADCAEEAAFYATLLPAGVPADGVRAHVRRIAALVLAACRAYLRAVQLSGELRRGGAREEMDEFLEAAHRAIALERETDAAQRAVHEALVAGGGEAGVSLFVVVELTRAFEETADALMHSAHLLREYALARVARSEVSVRRPPEGAARLPAGEPARPRPEHVYVLGDGARVPEAAEIGAKAHGLARIAGAGMRIPEAAVLTTAFAREHRGISRGDAALRDAAGGALRALEERTGLRLGSPRRPLLLSVRSGAPVSMPGMLETVLNVGMCDDAVHGLVAATGNPRLAWDCYRRAVESHAAVVHGCPREAFESAVRERIAASGAAGPRELGARALQELTRHHLARFAELTGEPFPQDPLEQLLAACAAVIASWDAGHAREYRRLRGIPDELGTAVIIQRMVFGNAGGISGAGVGFTRDPALGARGLYMDFLLDAQGEDVVGGRHPAAGEGALRALAPELLTGIEQVAERLEAEFGDAQEFELTVQDGETFLLQTRTAKRTPWAALRIATDQVREGLISPGTALARLQELDLDSIRRVHVDAPAGSALCAAVPASVGVATGPLALDRDSAERLVREGTPPVLVRSHALTEDVATLALAAGILTVAGGRTSHAAVVARELGKPCLVGCRDLEIDLAARTARIGGRLLGEGEVICLDAESGLVFAGAPAIVEERPARELQELARWRAELPRERERAPAG